MAPLLPTSRADIVSTIASHKVDQFKQNVGITKPSIEELRSEKRKRRRWTIVVGCGKSNTSDAVRMERVAHTQENVSNTSCLFI